METTSRPGHTPGRGVVFATSTRSGQAPFRFASGSCGHPEIMNDPANIPATTPTATKRHISADVLIGVGLIGSAVVGKLAWSVSDGGLLAALGAR
ncbi:hypothetical protein C6I20_14300 [Aeromicrobium sp. A1-2]|nr:hypothetical protein C6I20_14300 [Aeromicrobium sp. A1-2]